MTDQFKITFIATIRERLTFCKDAQGNYNHEAMTYITDLDQIAEWCAELLNNKANMVSKMELETCRELNEALRADNERLRSEQ